MSPRYFTTSINWDKKKGFSNTLDVARLEL